MNLQLICVGDVVSQSPLPTGTDGGVFEGFRSDVLGATIFIGLSNPSQKEIADFTESSKTLGLYTNESGLNPFKQGMSFLTS